MDFVYSLGIIDWQSLLRNPLLWGILCGAIALGLLLPGRSNRVRWQLAWSSRIFP